MRMRVTRRLAVMEARRNHHGRRRRVDLNRLSDGELDTLEQLALNRQEWSGSLEDWLASLRTAEHDELMRLHALAFWS